MNALDGRIRADLSIQVKQLLVGRKLLCFRDGDAQFSICLAIQLVRGDESRSGRVGRAEEREIGTHALVLLEQHEAADPYGRGRNCARGGGLSSSKARRRPGRMVGARRGRGRVGFAVPSVALVIVVRFFAHSDKEYKGE